jgi:uncharacterized phiE125 gp8 family phage protein
MPLKLITPAASPVLSLAEVKAHLRVDPDDHEEDALIELYRDAVQSELDGKDGWLGRALITQTWDLYLDEFPSREIQIPLPPLQSVTSVTYYDAVGDALTVDSGGYTVDITSQPGWIIPDADVSWPSTLNAANAVIVRFVAGYGESGSSVPAAIRSWMLLKIGMLYEHRETVSVGQVNHIQPAESLIWPYRMF